jgi:hypothetical protein
VPFKICITVPSALELLDTIEHRLSQYSRLSESPEEAQRFIDAFKKLDSRSFDEETIEGRKVMSLIAKTSAAGDNTRLTEFVSLFERGILSFVHEHMDKPDLISKNHEIESEYSRIFHLMDQRRSRNDTRSIDDRQFHYKVDSWNIAQYLVNQQDGKKEVDFVCRQTIRNYYPGETGQLYSRHPMVPMYHLYALFRPVPPVASIQNEASEFLKDAQITISKLVKDLEPYAGYTVSQLTEYTKSRIDDVYNKFIRPLFYRNYSNGGQAISVQDLARMRKEVHLTTYTSITSPEGFRDRFKQGAEGLKAAAQEVVKILPEITSDRLLEEYDLSGNPRIDEIRRKLNLG